VPKPATPTITVISDGNDSSTRPPPLERFDLRQKLKLERETLTLRWIKALD